MKQPLNFTTELVPVAYAQALLDLAEELGVPRQRLFELARVRPEVLTGTERERVWNDVVLARIPSVAKYERKAQRTIPVARLHPI